MPKVPTAAKASANSVLMMSCVLGSVTSVMSKQMSLICQYWNKYFGDIPWTAMDIWLWISSGLLLGC